MAGSYLLHNELHYNGLMTDWGLRTHAIRFAISNPMERGNCVWRMTRCFLPTTAIGYHERSFVYTIRHSLMTNRRLMCMWRIISDKSATIDLYLQQEEGKRG